MTQQTYNVIDEVSHGIEVKQFTHKIVQKNSMISFLRQWKNKYHVKNSSANSDNVTYKKKH